MQLKEEYPNIGSILDFAVLDVHKHGQSQIATCSGAFQACAMERLRSANLLLSLIPGLFQQDGSIRIIRNGVGLEERATIEMPGVQNMWSLRSSGGERQDILALAFVSQTAFLALSSEELEGIEVPGAAGSPALLLRDVPSNQVGH